ADSGKTWGNFLSKTSLGVSSAEFAVISGGNPEFGGSNFRDSRESEILPKKLSKELRPDPALSILCSHAWQPLAF
ncbi:MAG: hypothetical protein MJA29_02855, partial [Candidatus Omnitrophica bacterium]|nr:hypothetical protein [Candidatus Omnitrophota bacterium]